MYMESIYVEQAVYEHKLHNNQLSHGKQSTGYVNNKHI